MAVVGVWIWLETQPARDEAQARKNLRENVEVLRDRLGEAAADGSLPDTEIVQVFPPSKPAKGFVGVTRQGEAVTVVAEVLGQGPPRAFIFMYERFVTGCYAFEVPPPAPGAPRPSIRELPQEACAAGAATLPGPDRRDQQSHDSKWSFREGDRLTSAQSLFESRDHSSASRSGEHVLSVLREQSHWVIDAERETEMVTDRGLESAPV
ncbi:hypothetical protein ACFVRD_44390 [Streptomyces sp. NPDC057908]|uniref:hypothetical protein n=1 Tax=Streptomyces sp. NPDC057908 TaxID=3346276 RepID=UPI0036E5C5B4